jgi:NADH:ubiquinone oxidoreductase subunit F (NADH-binding)
MDIIAKIKKAELCGRGGANFPTDLKWQAVFDAIQKQPEHKSYIICNGAEGEPGVIKDEYLLKNYPETVIAGIKIALDFFKSKQAFIYLNKKYFNKYRSHLNKIIKQNNLPIVLFAETGGYLCGEETTLLESLEGKKEEPRLRPPFPTTNGYLGFPTLINNVETFYCVAKIAKNEFKQTRLYSLTGAILKPGVYELPQNYTVEQVLTATKNLPKNDYFVQVGGGACGEFFDMQETQKATGGTIIVYDLKKTNLIKLMRQLVNFLYEENCGKCTPCREGMFRLRQLLYQPRLDLADLKPLLQVMRNTSFCPLGKSVYLPIDSLINKIIYPYTNLNKTRIDTNNTLTKK